MEHSLKTLGTAKRVRVRMPLGAWRSAWDCRPFGFGRIIAPIAEGEIEITPGVDLDLATGTLRGKGGFQRRSA